MPATRLLIGAAAVLAVVCGSARAGTVSVSALDDIFLASRPNGASVTGYFGSDAAPAASPVQIAVTGGATLTFSATGTTSVDGSCFAGPDGGCYADESGFSPAPASNTYKGPSDALVGVFLGAGATNVAAGPASLDDTQAANRSLASQSPALDTIFFIGDGLTGTGTGAVQDFVAPAGATRLFIAAADSYGGSNNNLGGLTVAFTESAPAAGVPEPSAPPALLAGLAALAAACRSRRASRRIA